MRSLLKNFFLFVLIFVIIAGVFSSISTTIGKPAPVSISTVVQHVQEDKAQSIRVEGTKLTVTLKDGTIETSQKEAVESLPTLLKNYGVAPEKIAAVAIEVKDQSGAMFWIGTVLPFALPILFLVLFFYFMMRQIQGSNNRALSFGQSQAREQAGQDQRTKVTFKDVAGVAEAKEELWEVVDFLRSPTKYTDMGAKIPKGVLLVGPPGTGKTLLARAVAGEANAPFFHMSGSEFVEMFVGVGASRVRDLFRRAKKSAPCIIFIDEIDAVGRQRGSGLGGSHDEREQTLNQILVELDGFEQGTNIIVIAATNRPDVLDPALLRPGRFDRRVVLDPPDLNDREAILKVHSTAKPFGSDVNLRMIAERTPGFTGADLANVLNEAAILAARHDKKSVGMVECLESIEKVLLGPERKSHVLSEHEKRVTAYHEAAHALVAHELPHVDPIRKVSIISRGRAGGYTLKLPTEDKHLRTSAEFKGELAVLVAGFVAEKMFFGDVSTGPANDLKNATRLARKLVTEYGMSEALGPRTFGEHEELIFLGREITEQRNYSERIAQVIDREVDALISAAMKTAKTILKRERKKIDVIVTVLLKKETIEQEEFNALLGEKRVAEPVKPVLPEKDTHEKKESRESTSLKQTQPYAVS